jgi:hypothetical protein
VRRGDARVTESTRAPLQRSDDRLTDGGEVALVGVDGQRFADDAHRAHERRAQRAELGVRAGDLVVQANGVRARVDAHAGATRRQVAIEVHAAR